MQQLIVRSEDGSTTTFGTTNNVDPTNVVPKFMTGPITGIRAIQTDIAPIGLSGIDFLMADPCDPVVIAFPVTLAAGESTILDLKYYGQHHAYWTPKCVGTYALSLSTTETWITVSAFSLTLAPPATTAAATYSFTLYHTPLPSTTQVSTILSITITASSTICLTTSISLNPHSLQGKTFTINLYGPDPLEVPFPTFTQTPTCAETVAIEVFVDG